jgi:hypothetical protein
MNKFEKEVVKDTAYVPGKEFSQLVEFGEILCDSLHAVLHVAQVSDMSGLKLMVLTYKRIALAFIKTVPSDSISYQVVTHHLTQVVSKYNKIATNSK